MSEKYQTKTHLDLDITLICAYNSFSSGEIKEKSWQR